MSESQFRQDVIQVLRKAGMHPLAVEPGLPSMRGVPDVNYALGWIELKWLPSWPKRHSTKVRIPHFTTHQRRWLRRRWDALGGSHLLLGVGPEVLLFTGDVAAAIVGKAPRLKLQEEAVARWASLPEPLDLVHPLLRYRKSPLRLGGETSHVES